MKTFQSILIFVCLLLCGNLVLGQGSCQADVQLAFSRAYGACNAISRNQACYAGGTVTSNFDVTSADANFAQAGDIASLNTLRQIAVYSSASDDWSIAFVRLQANLSTNSQRNVFGILFGRAMLTNQIESLPQLTANPLGTVNIRTAPQQNSEIIDKVSVNGVLIANGRNDDNTWLRVLVPNRDQLGWVSRDLVDAESDIHTLKLVDVNDLLQQPFEHLLFQSSADSICDGAPVSGLLLQTPSLEERVTLGINGATLNIVGTVFIQAVAEDGMTVHMIEGTASISASDKTVRLRGGTRLQIPLDSHTQVSAPLPDIEPYNITDVQSTPYLYLDRRIQLPEPLSADAIAQLSLPITPTSEPPIATPADNCRYVVTSNQNIRNGPSVEYDITQTVAPNTLVYPQSQTTDINGAIWLQVGQRAWIQLRAVAQRGECNPLPDLAIDFITTATRNTLPLEDCQPINGPIEVGQRVTLEFIPNAWENFATARDATYSNRGQILVGDRPLYPWVSDPIKISENEFIRRFFAEWTAELGTHRLEGNHYSYEVICTITVVPKT